MSSNLRNFVVFHLCTELISVHPGLRTFETRTPDSFRQYTLGQASKTLDFGNRAKQEIEVDEFIRGRGCLFATPLSQALRPSDCSSIELRRMYGFGRMILGLRVALHYCDR